MVVQVVRFFSAYLDQSAPVAEKGSVEEVALSALPPRNPEHSPIKGEESPRIITPVEELNEAKVEAKKLEWQMTLDAIIKAFGPLPDEIEIPKPAKAYLKMRLERILGKADDQLMEELLQTESVEEFLSKHGLQRALSMHAHELLFELHCCFEGKYSFVEQYSAFEEKFLDLVSLIERASHSGTHDPETHAKAIWSNFRELLEHPVYGLMRCDETNSIIRRLHSLAIGAHAHTESVRSYHFLGDAIQKASHFKRSDSFSDVLTTSRLTAAESGFLVNDPPPGFRTSIEKLGKVFSTFLNCIMAKISCARTTNLVAKELNELFFATPKDPKDYRTLGNLPSHVYTERFSDNTGSTVDMRVVMHASPTKGEAIIPEFLAILQALENRQHSNIDNDPYPTTFYVYTNLQSRYEGNERNQTEAIMNLNERFPTVFHAVTLNADGLADLPFDDELPDSMLKVLLSEQSFTLTKTTGDSNYYFPANEKEKWKEVLTNIVKSAYNVIKNDRQIEGTFKTQATWELVHSDIIRYRELEAATNAIIPGKKREILIGRSCIVCVDRGPKEHSKQLMLLGANVKACAAIHLARGPEAKGRLPVDKRVRETGRFLKSLHGRRMLTEHFRQIGAIFLEKKRIISSEITSPGIDLRTPSKIEFMPQRARRKVF